MSRSEIKLVTLNESNFRQVAPTLRAIADEIESGKFGDVGSCAVVILGNKLDVFASGRDSDPASAALLLHAGFQKLSTAVMNAGE